jgi:transposase
VYGCQQVLLNPNGELGAVLEFICLEANKLTNCGVYYARQLSLKTKKIISKFDLDCECNSSKHFQALHSQTAEQVLRSIAESLESFKQLDKAYKKGELQNKLGLPCFYAEFVYKQQCPTVSLDQNNPLGIDAEIGNWLTCISNVGTSFIVDKRKITTVFCKVGIAHQYLKCVAYALLRAMPTRRFVV